MTTLPSSDIRWEWKNYTQSYNLTMPPDPVVERLRKRTPEEQEHLKQMIRIRRRFGLGFHQFPSIYHFLEDSLVSA